MAFGGLLKNLVLVVVCIVNYGFTVFVCLKFLARFESYRLTGRYSDFLASARISSNATFPRFDDEHTEAPQLDSLTPGQCFLHRMEQSFDCLLRFHLRHTGFVSNAIDDI
jgi:hypothetical protein